MACRQALCDSVHEGRRPKSRTLADAHELRRFSPSTPQFRLMGHLRTWVRKSKSARLCGHVSGWIPNRRHTKLAVIVLASAYQGTYLNTEHKDVEKLVDNIRNSSLNQTDRRLQLDLLQKWNRRHLDRNAGDPLLEARIQAHELAFRMQTEAADVFDLSKESKWTRELYGDTVIGRQLLLTRRMIEKGVRFVQVWSGAGQPWDNHDNLEAQHRSLGRQWDQPIAAFLLDLSQRGLLDETLVLWGGEFGRTPVGELPALNGRDHNHYGFSVWLAGGASRAVRPMEPPTNLDLQHRINPFTYTTCMRQCCI